MVVLLTTSFPVVTSGDGQSEGCQTYEYVIITPKIWRLQNYHEGWDALLTFRRSRGLTATIVILEDILDNPDYGVNGIWGDGNSDNPYISEPVTTNLGMYDDTPARIRNFIRFAHSEWGTKYVLLGSGYNKLPARQLYFGSAELYYAATDAVSRSDKIKTAVSGPSDLYFGCLEGSFNSNGDNRWGEPDDGQDVPCGNGDVDLRAEVFVGRALIANSYYDSYSSISGIYDVKNFVKKTIEYETIIDDPYLRNVLMVGDALSPPADPCGGSGVGVLWAGDELDKLVDGVIPLTECDSSDPSYNAAVLRDIGEFGDDYHEPLHFTGGEGIPSSKYKIFTLYDRDGCPCWTIHWGRIESGWPAYMLLRSINGPGVHIINQLGGITEFENIMPQISGSFMKLLDWNTIVGNDCLVTGGCVSAFRWDIYNTLKDMLDFENEGKPFFIYSQDDFSGAFDYCQPSLIDFKGSNTPDDPVYPARNYPEYTPNMRSGFWECPAETLLKQKNAAVAAIMPSRHGWVGWDKDSGGNAEKDWENNKITLKYNQEFWKVMFGTNTDGPHTQIFSEANQYSKEALIDHINDTGMRWGYYGLNYFGDPALTLNTINTNSPPDAVDDIVETVPLDELENLALINANGVFPSPDGPYIEIDVLDNDNDPDDGDIISVTNVGSASHGIAANVWGPVVYQPSNGFEGTDSFTYTITNGNDEFDTATVTVNVRKIGTSPVVSDIPDQTIYEGESFSPIILNNYVTDDNSISEIGWIYGMEQPCVLPVTIDDNGVATIGTDWGPSYCYHSDGVKRWVNICFKAIDPYGNADYDWVTFTVINSVNDPPVANFVFSPSNPAIRDSVRFTDLSHDDGDIISWNWDFDDGTTSNTQNPSHVYTIANTYTISLTVEDNDGGTNNVQKTITVTETNSPELAVSTNTINAGTLGLNQTTQVSFEIWNNGEGLLEYTLSTTKTWITPNALTGDSYSEKDTITVEIDTHELLIGSYNADIFIVSNGGNKKITINLDIMDNALSISITHPSLNYLYLRDSKMFNLPSLDNYSIILGPINIEVETNGTYDYVKFYIDDALKNTTNLNPCNWMLNQRIIGFHTVKVIAVSDDVSVSDEIDILIFCLGL